MRDVGPIRAGGRKRMRVESEEEEEEEESGEGGGVGSTIDSSPGGMGVSLNEISDVGPIGAGGRKRTPNVRLQDHEKRHGSSGSLGRRWRRIRYDTENNVRREETNNKLRKKTTLIIAGKNKKGAFKKIKLIFPGK